MLTLAFDTATNVATSALVWDDEALAELTSRPVSVLEDVDALFRRGGVPAQLEALVVGTGPGSPRACGWGSRPPARCPRARGSRRRRLDAARPRGGRAGVAADRRRAAQ